MHSCDACFFRFCRSSDHTYALGSTPLNTKFCRRCATLILGIVDKLILVKLHNLNDSKTIIHFCANSSTRIVVASVRNTLFAMSGSVAYPSARCHLILLYRNQSRRQKVIAGRQSVPLLQPPTDAIPLVTYRRHDQKLLRARGILPSREKPQNATDAAPRRRHRHSCDTDRRSTPRHGLGRLFGGWVAGDRARYEDTDMFLLPSTEANGLKFFKSR